MLSKALPDVESIKKFLKNYGGQAIIEKKYDGERV
jgi:ATP-dependent DNA ligase